MPLYENVFIARQEVSSEQVQEIIKDFSNTISENGGTVQKVEYWGLRTLAYPIRKNRKGHYALMHIDAPVGAMAEMERQMRLHEDVFRFLNTRVEAFDPEPSPLMSQRQSTAYKDAEDPQEEDAPDKIQNGLTEETDPPMAAEGAVEGAAEEATEEAAEEAAEETHKEETAEEHTRKRHEHRQETSQSLTAPWARRFSPAPQSVSALGAPSPSGNLQRPQAPTALYLRTGENHSRTHQCGQSQKTT